MGNIQKKFIFNKGLFWGIRYFIKFKVVSCKVFKNYDSNSINLGYSPNKIY